MEFDTIIDRFKKVAGITTNRAIAETFNMTESNLYAYRKKGNLPLEHIIRYCLEHGLDLNYIFKGEARLVDIGDGFEIPDGFVSIPFFENIKASAGGGCINGECAKLTNKRIVVDRMSLPTSDIGGLFAVKVVGDSMAENIKHGAIVIANNHEKEFEEDGLFVVSTVYGDTFIKRLRRDKNHENILLHSDNHYYGDIVEPMDSVKIHAKVVLFYNQYITA